MEQLYTLLKKRKFLANRTIRDFVKDADAYLQIDAFTHSEMREVNGSSHHKSAQKHCRPQ